jgi:hypothetical protein
MVYMPITVENARELQVQSAQVRKVNTIKRNNLFALVQEMESKLQAIAGVVEEAGKPDLAVLKELNRVTKALHNTDPGSLEYTRLVQAHSTLYSLIHPKPGVARPRRTRQPQSLPLPEPVCQAPVTQEPRPTQVQPAQVVPGTNPATPTQG